MARKKKRESVLEKFMLPNVQWQEGYKSFNQLFGKPMGWLYFRGKEGSHRLSRLDRKDSCRYYNASPHNRRHFETSLQRFFSELAEDRNVEHDFPFCFKDVRDRPAIVFALTHLGKIKGFLALTALKRSVRECEGLTVAFQNFLQTQVDLAYKNFELNNFYETVHPRALALSTMHSVHRVISSSVRLNDLLPRIGRLSAQVLKAKGCSIMLVDSDREYLLPSFKLGDNPHFVHRQRVRIGRGADGRIAATGEFHLSRRSIAVPFIEEDVVGIIRLWDKVDRQPFSKTDLEILKSLSEQAVVAIKNAQLFEETEQLTLGSIKAINELLELNFGGDRSQLPVFGDLVVEVAKELELSGREQVHLQRAIMLRDAGAFAFPESVMQKTGKLTKKEQALVKRIPMRGAQLLRSISSLQPVIPIILHHRERFDGKGYPQGLKGEEIPIGARIVSVVDSFVAMISKRSYRHQMSLSEAVEEIQTNSGTQFDPRVVKCFVKVIRRESVWKRLVETSKVFKQSVRKA